MSDSFVLVPRATAPPVGLSAEQVAADLGWEVEWLWEAVRAGSLPSPDWYGGRPQFSHKYALQVRCDGLRIPGTYPVILLPYSATKAKARRKGKRKVNGRKPAPASKGKPAPASKGKGVNS